MTQHLGTTVRRAAVLAIATATALTALGTLSVGAAPAQAATTTIKVVQHNVEKRPDAIAAALAKAEAVGAQGVTLQEVCSTQLGLVTAKGWSVHVTASRPGGCESTTGVEDDNANVVAAFTGTGGTPETVALPADPGRTPALTCVRWGSSPARHVCSVHLVAFAEGSDVRLRQTRAIKSATAQWISQGHAVFLGGDFNAKPGSGDLDPVYGVGGGGGAFVEGHQLKTGDPTRTGAITAPGTQRKIDYVFFSQNRTPFPSQGNLQLFTTSSDHKMLVGTGTVRTS